MKYTIDYPTADHGVANAAALERFIMEVPVISSRHFSHRDHDALRDGCADFVHPDGPFFIILIGGAPPRGFTRESLEVIRCFEELGYSHLCIHGECGDIIEGLPTYEW